MTKSILAKGRRKLPRSPNTGKFEPNSPFSDPALLRYATDCIQAAETVSPALLALAHGSGVNTPAGRLLLQGLGAILFLRESLNLALAVGDKQTNCRPDKIDVQLLISNFQGQWRRILEELPPLVSLRSDDSDEVAR